MDQASATHAASALGFDPAALVRFTAEQFEAIYNAGVLKDANRVDLREGLPCLMSPQNIPHATVKAEVYEALLDSMRALGLPLRIVSEASVRVGDYNVPQPDITVWDPIRARGAIPVARVRLVAEIRDTTQDEDFGRKPALYAAASIPEYWIVDLPSRVIHQRWAPLDGAYSQAKLIPFGDAVASTAVPGLVIDTAALRDQDTAE